MVVKSKLAPAEIPDIPLHYAVFANVEEMADRTILVDGMTDKSYTFREVRDISFKISKVLQDRGLKKGDTLAIVCPNCPEFALMVYGCMALGVIVTTVNPVYTVYELTRQIRDSGATYIFTSTEQAPKAKKAALESGQIKEIFVTGSAPGCTPFKEFLGYSGPPFEWTKIEFNPKEDVCFLPYSSGTTGLPKGVLTTHRNVLAALIQVSDEVFKDPNDDPSVQGRVLGMLPFYHAYGLLIVLIGVVAGGGMVVTLPRFKPELFLRTIEKYKLTYLPLVPPLMIFMMKNKMAKQFDLSSVKRVGSGAAPLMPETESEFKKSSKVDLVRQGYGMTETSPVALVSPFANPKPGSVGILLPSTEAMIVGQDTGRELGPNQRGELWIRGPQIMKGYHNRPEETRKTLDGEGWLHTGDVAYYDEDEYFFIVDRYKELIKYKGLQIAPAELEALLLTHPAVADAAITSIPDVEAGELPIAYIVKKEGAALTQDDVIKFVAERAAPHKQLRGGVEFVNEIPKLESGKILRRLLKERAAKKHKSSKL